MSEDAEKPHEATPRKLEKAREKGEVAKSAELNTLALYFGFVCGTILIGPFVLDRIIDAGGTFIAHAWNLEMANAGIYALKEIVINSLFLVAAPAVTICLVIALQRSAVIAPTKIAPKLSRISFISGVKNKFGPSGLFEFGKSGFKMIIYATLLTLFLWISADSIVSSAALPMVQSVSLMLHLSFYAFIVVIGIAAIVATIDFAWQRHVHLTKNRMTRQEIVDENKDTDGDPQFKARRRQRAQELASNRMLADVPDATVIVVNPTHFAVALKWSAMDPTPPVCLAKGVDQIATRIREAAAIARIPVFSDPPTARALYATVKIGEPIPREHFQAVAAAIRFAEDLKQGASEN